MGKEIGLTDFPWMLSPEGVCSGGNGVSLTAEDMLRVGLLYLNKGKWSGKQLISEKWINYALGYTDPIEPVDGLQYNFHWDHAGDIWAARGMFGQTCGLVPALDMTFAITAADSRYMAMKLFQKEVINPTKAGRGPEITDEISEEILKQKGLRMTLEEKIFPRKNIGNFQRMLSGLRAKMWMESRRSGFMRTVKVGSLT